MAKLRVSVVHDELGNIVSVSRPSKGAKVIIMSGDGQSVTQSEVDERLIPQLVSGSYSFDTMTRSFLDQTAGGEEQKTT